MKNLWDKGFIKNAVSIGTPIMLQQLLIQGMRLLDSLMIGTLGQKEVLAVGNAGQVSFLMYVFLFGAGSSAGVFTAQFWGKGDMSGIKKTLSFTLFIALLIALPFFTAGFFFPETIMSLMNSDPEIVSLGASYLKIDSLSYLFFAMAITFTSVLKGTRQTKLPLLTSFIAVALNAFLNWVFIFGNLGMPRLGVAGAATGTAAAIIVEFILVYVLSQRKKNPVRMRLKELHWGSREFRGHFMRKCTPILINEMLWSLGNFGLVLIFNRMGEASAATMAIFVVLERMCYIVFNGLANTSSIFVGNYIGAKNEKKAYDYAGKFLFSGVACAVVLGGLLIAIRGPVISLYNIPAATAEMLGAVIIVFGCVSWMSVFNFISIIGVLRGGGDTKFAAFIDLAAMYFFSLPIAYVLGVVLRLPIYWVYLCFIVAGDGFRAILGVRRILSKKWIHNIVEESEIFEVQL